MIQWSPGWWYTYPSEKYEFVSWDDELPNWMESHKIPWFQSPPTSHQSLLSHHQRSSESPTFDTQQRASVASSTLVPWGHGSTGSTGARCDARSCWSLCEKLVPIKNSGFTHWKWWFSIVMWQFTRPGTLDVRNRNHQKVVQRIPSIDSPSSGFPMEKHKKNHLQQIATSSMAPTSTSIFSMDWFAWENWHRKGPMEKMGKYPWFPVKHPNQTNPWIFPHESHHCIIESFRNTPGGRLSLNMEPKKHDPVWLFHSLLWKITCLSCFCWCVNHHKSFINGPVS